MGTIFARVQPPDSASNCYVWILRFITILQILIVISNFICLNQFLVQAIFGILLILLLIVAFHKLSYQSLIIYIFFSIFFTITFLVYIFTPVQQQQHIQSYDLGDMYCWIDAIVSCFFYICVSLFCFFPYKAFKIFAFNANPALANYFDWQQQQRNRNQNNDNNNNQHPKDKFGTTEQKRNTQEQLHRVDYLRQQPHQPHYQENNQTSNRGAGGGGGGFNAFKGQGVRIG